MHTYRKQSKTAQWIISTDISPIFLQKHDVHIINISLFLELKFQSQINSPFCFQPLKSEWNYIVTANSKSPAQIMQMDVSVWTIVASVCLAAKQVAIDVMGLCDCLWNCGRWCRSIAVPHAGRTKNSLCLIVQNADEEMGRADKNDFDKCSCISLYLSKFDLTKCVVKWKRSIKLLISQWISVESKVAQWCM